MSTALVVDDSAVDRKLAANLLEQRAAIQVTFAENGRAALESIASHCPDLVVSDVQMPEMDGLKLVETLRASHPKLPVILMTAHGSEEMAALALRKGAASYVPKKFLSRDLAPTAERVLELAGIQRQQEQAIACLDEAICRFTLDNDSDTIGPVIRYLKQEVAQFQLCDENDLMRICVALDEALCNAIHHGNLAVDSSIREEGLAAYFDMIAQRAAKAPWNERRVHLVATVNPEQATFIIRDEGEGFDASTLDDPTDPANLEKTSGRGLLLIRTFMDHVDHNDRGNQITMIKRRVNHRDDQTNEPEAK